MAHTCAPTTKTLKRKELEIFIFIQREIGVLLIGKQMKEIKKVKAPNLKLI